MRLSQFRELLADEFGAEYGEVLIRDLVLSELGDQTSATALAAGIDPRQVWLALCRANQVPVERWHGKLKPKAAENSPEQRAEN